MQITGNYQNGEDILDFTDTGSITGTFNTSTGTLTLSGSDTLADYQTALRAVTYENTSDDPDTPTRTVTFTVNDGDADSNQPTRNITVTASNDAPALANLEAADVDYTEGDGAIVLTSAITVSDADDTNIDSATVQITANYQNGEDVLDFTDTGSIAGSFNSTTGTMSLTGSTTVANYQTALRAVTFENTSEAPDTSTRTVTFTVNDGDANSNQPTRDITVAASNDAPALANLEAADVDYIEGDGAIALTSAITVTDVDDTNLDNATVQISGNYQNGEDLLDFTDTGSITGSFNSTTGTMTFTGSTTVANYQTALRSVTYENTSEAPDTLDRTVTFTVNDGDANSNQPTRNITVAASNDAPALANLEATDVDYTEGDAAVATTSAITVSDADDTNLDSATVQITANYQNGEDVLDFTDQLAISGSFNSTTGTMTLTGSTTVANYQTALQAVTYENTSDAPDTLDRTVTFTVNDGDANSNQLTRDVTIMLVPNQPPVADAGSDQTVECTSPSGADVTLDGSGSSDPDNATLTYTWREGGNVIAGPITNATSPPVTLALGAHTIELTVDDGDGEISTDEVIVTVQDTTPPTVTLTSPSNTGAFVTTDTIDVQFTVNDSCDANPSVTVTPGDPIAAPLTPGNLLIKVDATDASGNTGSVSVTVVVSLEIRLNDGWNLISIPLILADPNIQTVFADLITAGGLEVVRAFDQGAETFDPANPPPISDLIDIEPGQGYWVRVNQGTLLTLTGAPAPRETQIDLDTTSTPWNLISYLPDSPFDPQNASDDLETILAPLIAAPAAGAGLQVVRSYGSSPTDPTDSPGAKTWVANLTNFSDLNVLSVYRGFWLRVQTGGIFQYHNLTQTAPWFTPSGGTIPAPALAG